MNVKQLITLTALAVAGSAAMADDPTVVHSHFVAQKTRAQVQAEVMQARAAGTLVIPEVGTWTAAETASTASRDQVRAEVRAMPKSGVPMYGPGA